MFKKISFSLLAVIGVLAAVSGSVTASGTLVAEYSDGTYDYELYQGNTAALTYCGSVDSTVSVPETVVSDGGTYKVTELKKFSFSFASPTEVTLPDSVDTIGDSAFYECVSLESIRFPENLAKIDGWAFGECSSLRSVTVNSAAQIGEWAFSDCTSLKCADISGTTSLGENAFNSCSGLTSIFMSADMESIGADAFYGCYNLSDIYFEGTQNEWGAVQISSGNDYLKKADVHFVGSSAVKNAIVMQKYLVNSYSLDKGKSAVFDINGDNQVNVFDAILIKRRLN